METYFELESGILMSLNAQLLPHLNLDSIQITKPANCTSLFSFLLSVTFLKFRFSSSNDFSYVCQGSELKSLHLMTNIRVKLQFDIL